MVECDGYVRWNSRLGLGHISWGRLGTNGANMTTFGLRTECMLSYGYGNPILQYLRGKSRLLFVYEFLKWLTNNIITLLKNIE